VSCAPNDAGRNGTGAGGRSLGASGSAGVSASAGAGGAETSSGGALGFGGARATGGTGAEQSGAAGAETARAGGGNAGSAGMMQAGAPAGGMAGTLAAGTSGGAGMGGRANDAGAAGSAGSPNAPVKLTLLDHVVFYDGYAALSAEPVPTGAQRLRNDLLSHKLSEEELGAIQNTLALEVVIGALCDNYDRIGSVALALVPKGQSTYAPDDVDRIEVARFITPFMDWNKKPDEVPYDYTVDNLVPVLHDTRLREKFDFWFELELFGVPYSANTQVAGCANRSDVFSGTLTLASDTSRAAPVWDGLVPLAYKVSFNDYERGASDMLGKTRKTLPFELDADTADAELVLIVSNHGANSGGEEYSRRDHFVYVDDELLLMYKPGRTSCEPFRKYNTQSNGIYGSSARSDSDWQSFSNWCPGDVIDTRILPLGPASAGQHEFVIDVPDAVFMGDDGNFPLSLYLQTRAK
jgi:hypothetical protein